MSTNKEAQAIISDIKLKHGSGDVYAPIIRWDEFQSITGALEAAESRIAELEAREVKIPELKMLSDYLREVTLREREDIILGVKLEFHRNLKSAGISVKGE